MKKKNNRLVGLFVWVLLAVIVIWMASGSQIGGKKAEKLDYKSFLTLVQRTVYTDLGKKVPEVTDKEVKVVEQTIRAIQIEYREVYGLYDSTTDKAEKLPKNADFYAVIPSEATFREDLAAILHAADAERYPEVGEIDTTLYPFTYESKLQTESWWSIILPYVIMFGSVVLLYWLIMRQQGGGKQMSNFGKSHARVQTGDENRITFADVAGADEEKAELQEVVEFMKEPKRYSDIGARVPKGVLLVGPPGTGKTLLAKAVAGEAKVPFFSISGSDFVEMFVGVGASRVRDLFLTAKRSTPAVVFIDEIDAVGRHRGAGMGGGNDEREQTLNQLLVEMDGFAPNEGIVVIAATNRPDILDPALLRPGRFDRQITVNYPDVKGREAILKVHARNKPLAEDVSLGILAQRTPGFTGADLENVLNEGAILAARRKKKIITMDELEEAITRVQMGPEKKSRAVTELDKRLTAYHEAGHAIVAMKLEHCDPVHEVSIIPRGMAGGYTMVLPKEDANYTTRGKILDTIAMSLGGRVAEKLRMDDISTGAYSDLQHASDLARKMVTEYGMSEEIGPIFLGGQTEVFIGMEWGHGRNYSEELAAKVDTAIQKILDEQLIRAEETVASDLAALDRVAEMLIKYERVTGEEFAAVYNGADAEQVVNSDVFFRKNGKGEPEATAETPVEATDETPVEASAEAPVGAEDGTVSEQGNEVPSDPEEGTDAQ